jgi:trypsin
MRLLTAVTMAAMAIVSFSEHALTEECKDPRRIVGGEKTDIKEHPWQVALDVKGGLCGGSIIAHNWVLTAAHCFNDTSQPADVRVKAGSTNYKIAGGWTAVERVVVHERYQAALSEVKKIQNPLQRGRAIDAVASDTGYDLALLKLKVSLPGQVIPFVPPDYQARPCEHLEVTGWGRTSEGGVTSDDLRKATVPYVENSVCNQPGAYAGKIQPSMMCAGWQDDEGGIDSCQGDSGGPLVVPKGPDGALLVGVVSWGYGCARKLKYGVYTRVNSYREWIARVITTDGRQ